ncbi:MAG TPA: class II aldolase/adducin family protein [Gemmatimonadaceae bacterium]|nr:class II aldolase/adducin family protein [Gemmatimonadaceae bacterium]
MCRRLTDAGLIAGQDGNVSVRLDARRILVTPAGFSKIDVTASDLVVLSLQGKKIRGKCEPSSEVAVHLRAYARRRDVAAVVHAHPPTATAFAVVGETLPERVLPEIAALLGPVPLVPYATPGTEALADRFDGLWASHDAFLMVNHGALTLGSTLRVAHQRMETMEHAARIVFAARALGAVRELTPEQLRELSARRDEYRRA